MRWLTARTDITPGDRTDEPSGDRPVPSIPPAPRRPVDVIDLTGAARTEQAATDEGRPSLLRRLLRLGRP